jgi:hypothetical protein
MTWGTGFSPVSRVGTGQYRFSLSTAAGATADYTVRPTSLDNAAPQMAVVRNSSSSFDVYTFSPAGAATDCANFSLEACHKP